MSPAPRRWSGLWSTGTPSPLLDCLLLSSLWQRGQYVRNFRYGVARRDVVVGGQQRVADWPPVDSDTSRSLLETAASWTFGAGTLLPRTTGHRIYCDSFSKTTLSPWCLDCAGMGTKQVRNRLWLFFLRHVFTATASTATYTIFSLVISALSSFQSLIDIF